MIVDEIVGRFTAASNTTLLGRSSGRPVVYKPVAGNRPLWDFDVDTLAAREVLAYEVSTAMGYDLVPETVMGDGPFGPGAVQAYIDVDADFDALEPVRRGDPRLWPVAVLDLVINNADRKLGHILMDGTSHRIRGIDHGLTFHAEDKLRTVLWAFAGSALPAPEVAALESLTTRLDDDLGGRCHALIGRHETEALIARVSSLLSYPVHPDPPDDRPPIPWPPY